MDVFALRGRLVDDYSEFTRSFITIADERVRTVVEQVLDEGLLWPEALIQLNPSFAPGATIDELVADGTLDPRNAPIFRRKRRVSGTVESEPLRLHRHQEEAIRAARTGA